MNGVHLLLLFLLPSAFQRHDFHTSLTEIQVNAKEKTLEVTLRVFTDDLEKVLTKAAAGQKIHLVVNDRHDPSIDRYVKEHFLLTNAKGERKALRYLGKEFESDATWIYLEIPFAEALTGAKLQNDILLDLFDDQTNLVNLLGTGERKSFIFNQ
ncbi:MAG: hypothetical protein H7Y12_04720, partial [Sphingobacteriaceae bacterium]|nr:hypothetical protein [Cytophagaceae bacterium]